MRKNGDGAPEVVDGKQRVRCAREANKRILAKGGEVLRVKVILEKGSDADVLATLIVTNEFNQTDGPLAKAQKCARYLSLGRSEAEAALYFNTTTQTIKDWTALVGLAPSVQKQIDAGKLSATAARQLAPLKRDEQEATAAQLIEGAAAKGGQVTVADARAARNVKKGKTDAAPGVGRAYGAQQNRARRRGV